jgi:hypothetical protein
MQGAAFERIYIHRVRIEDRSGGGSTYKTDAQSSTGSPNPSSHLELFTAECSQLFQRPLARALRLDDELTRAQNCRRLDQFNGGRTELSRERGKLGIEFADFRQIRDEPRVRRVGIFGLDPDDALERLGAEQLFDECGTVFN